VIWSNEQLWLVLDRLATVLGLVTLFTLGGVAINFGRRVKRERRRRRLQAARQSGPDAPTVAVSVSFPGSDTADDVQRAIEERCSATQCPILTPGATVRLPPGAVGIVEFRHPGQLTPATVYRELERMRALKAWLEGEGFREVHLFLQTPVAFAALLGSLFTNWRAVHLYHWNRDRAEYEYWLPLSSAKALPDEPGTLPELMAGAVAEWLEAGRDPEAAPPPDTVGEGGAPGDGPAATGTARASTG
jgi:hypothetical protein